MKRGFAYLLLLLVFLGCESKKGAVLDAEAFDNVIRTEPNLQLVDVRTPEEFQSGHLENALLIDFYAPNFQDRLTTLNRDQPIAVYCAVGQRSEQVYHLLQEKGFKEVYHLKGGLQDWKLENKPVIRE